MKQKEEWKAVPNYERYLVSNTGRVISTLKNRTKELKAQQDAIGYLHFRLYPTEPIHGFYPNGRGKKPRLFKAHKLTLETFCPTLDTTLEVNHKDGNKHNNSLDNLEWVTRQQNIQHSWDLGVRANMHTKVARVNRKPLVAIHRSGQERYFSGNIVAKFGLGCSLGTIANVLRSGKEIERGAAKGYTLVRISELPNDCQFEDVPDLQEKIEAHNAKYFSKNWKQKKIKKSLGNS